MKRLVLGVTAPKSFILLLGQVQYFKSKGYQVYYLSPRTPEVEEFCRKEGCELLAVPIKREISVISDIACLITIIRYLMRVKPDVVNVGTPKMGLLGMIAAWLLRVPKRVYTCRGFRYEHEAGLKRRILMFTEKIASSCSHTVICISQSIKDLGIKDGVLDTEKCVLIGRGSSNGVDLTRFDRSKVAAEEVAQLKAQLGIGGKFVFGFVGRIIDRKGIKELYEAFVAINEEYPETRLVIVGGVNLPQVSDPGLLKKMEAHPAIVLTGFQSNVPLYLATFDVFVLPAWWEGFGNTLIQAAAMQIPVITTDVTGCKNAVSKDFNGLVIEGKSTTQLQEAMLLLMRDQDRRRKFGKNGLLWAREFDSVSIWNEMDKIYRKN